MKELYKKINEIQQEIGKLSKKSENPFFKSAYLDLNDLIDAINPLLESKNLMLIQPIIKGFVVSKVIDLETEKEFLSELELPNLTDAQKIGSAITYYRRYTLKSMFNIQEIEDDANIASDNNKKPASDSEKRELTGKEVENIWNGKIYGGRYVYINDKKIQPTQNQIDKLKKHTKYINDEK